MELLESLKKNPFVLAPMAGITDCAFRSFMKEMGAGIVVTELISGHGVEYNNAKTLKLMAYEEFQRPVGIQLFGEEPDIIGRAAKLAQERGADFVDLNFGCPVPKVVKKGAGSAILKDLKALQEMVSTVKKHIEIPLTIKIRTGWDETSRNAKEVAHIAYNEGVTWVAIHGRTRAQGYSGISDWEYIGDVRANSKIPIIGNGDIHRAEQAVERLTKYSLDGVMIGRGCLKNPWIFLEAQTLLSEKQIEMQRHVSGQDKKNFHPVVKIERDFRSAFFKLKAHLDKQCDEKILHLQLKKFASWFSTGYPGASKFRRALFESKSVEDVWSTIERYFSEINSLIQADTSSEAFLMGGHG